MKLETVDIILPEGNFEVEVQKFEESDRKILFKMYKEWISLNDNLRKFHSRVFNLPEGLFEGAFCLEMGYLRLTHQISGANTSFDCYDPVNCQRIQVKASSILPDLTSFGPRSEWDKLYFIDFYKEGKWDGSFDIYFIKNDDIYNYKVNGKETMKDQQIQGRRPRFSIFKDIIEKNHIRPVKFGCLNK